MPTLAELAGDYVAHLETRVGDRDPKRRRSARTVADVRYKLDRYVLPVIGGVRADDVAAADVLRLLDRLAALRLSPNTRTGLVSNVSGLLRYGAKRGLVERNVVRDVDRDDRPGAGRMTEPRYLTGGELNLLLSHLSDTFRPVAAACAFAGLRVSEALGLRWRDVDLTAYTLTVSGQLGRRGERVPLKTAASAGVERELRAHRSRQAARNLRLVHADALVFVTATGKPQSPRNVLRAVHKAGADADLNGGGRERVGLYDLRHSYVAGTFAAGASLAEVAALARHANARVTAQVYAGLTENGRETAAAKLLESGFGR